jgi:hypothetical protein
LATTEALKFVKWDVRYKRYYSFCLYLEGKENVKLFGNYKKTHQLDGFLFNLLQDKYLQCKWCS